MKRMLLLFVLALPAPAAGCDLVGYLLAESLVRSPLIPPEPDAEAGAMFGQINAAAFDGRLRTPTGIHVDDDPESWGRTLPLGRYAIILLSRRLEGHPDAKRAALAHEMVHLALGDGGHGPAFEAEAKRVAAVLGIEPERLLRSPVGPAPPPM